MVAVWRSLAAVVTLVALLPAPACRATGGDRPRDAIPPITGARPAAQRHPFGLKWNWDQLDVLRPHLEATAGGATFFELSWCSVEPSRGRRDWTRVDEVADASAALGYELYLKIRVGSCWTNGREDASDGERQKRPSAMPRDLDAYASFVAGVVERYGPRGVRAYAIENEVNARNFWVDSPADYERLVEVGAAAVRAADPDARVLDSGVSSIAYGAAVAYEMLHSGDAAGALRLYRDYYRRRFAEPSFVFPNTTTEGELAAALDDEPARRARDFLAATFRLARRGIVDAYQLHYYEPWRNLPVVLGYVRAAVGPDVPVEAWEVGVAWPAATFDEKAHAEETAKLLVTLLGSGVNRAIYLPAAYTPGGRRNHEIWRGLYLPSGEPRPAAGVYAQLVDAAGGNEVTVRPVHGRELSGVAFSRGETSAFVVWSDGGVTLPGPPPAGAQARQLVGSEIEWGRRGLMVTNEPVLVTWPGSVDEAMAAWT